MASLIQAVNMGLTLLGASRITSLEDDVKPAREASAIYEIVRDSLLTSSNWTFAKARAQLPALADAPLFGYQRAFQLPSDCLRLVMVGEHYVGTDVTDYRGGPTEEYSLEGRTVLTDQNAPLSIIYIKRVTDTTQWAAQFTRAFAAALARDLAEALTQSNSKRELAIAELKSAISEAIRTNAIEQPPVKLADDEWVLSRR